MWAWPKMNRRLRQIEEISMISCFPTQFLIHYWHHEHTRMEFHALPECPSATLLFPCCRWANLLNYTLIDGNRFHEFANVQLYLRVKSLALICLLLYILISLFVIMNSLRELKLLSSSCNEEKERDNNECLFKIYEKYYSW